MKKSKIITSLASIALCFSMVVGGSYALFTSESTVNIAVTSGKVDVKATIDEESLQTYSYAWNTNSEKYDSVATDVNGTFTNGGTATFDNEANLALNRMSPGDKATFTIDVANQSNVTVKYRVCLSADGELVDALIATANIEGKEYVLKGVDEQKTVWQTVLAKEEIEDIQVTVEFPDNEKVNDYMQKSATLTYTVQAVQGNAPIVDTWDGTADTSWYNDIDTEFTLSTSEALAGLAQLVDGGNTFAGKTIKLDCDLDLYYKDENGNAICFQPIGSYRHDKAFTGTFDGNDHTISNFNQNTWALNNGYYYGDLGLGLFGYVEDANIKNLNVDGASLSGESAICGIIAGCAYGDCTFENITVSNSQGADYQYYSGGIVGWASGDHKYINCDVDASTTIAAQWGDFDNSTGGIIGGCGGSATILLKDCDVACRIDAYNDVTSSNQWYAYRRCGMLIGNTGKTQTTDGTTYAAAPQLTCENVTVTYGQWANYTYCEFAGTSWPYVRVQSGVSNSAYSNPRYGHPTDANGNEVVDDNHIHNDGEDHQILCIFDQLYGGGQGVYGTATHDGVTVIYNNK